MASTGEAWRLGRRPALDGLRGVAVLLVLGDHFGVLPRPTGSIGVTVFFALSGFLITRVIVESRQDGRWSFGEFFGNRLARLLPALMVMVVVTGALAIGMGQPGDVVVINAARAVLYVQNFFMDVTVDWWMFRHTWSLAVEEQFYLVWPLVLPWLLRSRRPLLWVAAGVVGSLVLRFVIFAAGAEELAQASLFGNAFALLLGCGLALVRPRTAPRFGLPFGVVALVGVLAVSPLLAAPHLVGPVGGAAASVLLVWGGLNSHGVFTAAPLRFLGRISYALYLWHLPLIWLLGGPAALPLSFLVAAASTVWLEEPVRRWWRQRRSGLVSPSTASAMTAGSPRLDEGTSSTPSRSVVRGG